MVPETVEMGIPGIHCKASDMLSRDASAPSHWKKPEYTYLKRQATRHALRYHGNTSKCRLNVL